MSFRSSFESSIQDELQDHRISSLRAVRHSIRQSRKSRHEKRRSMRRSSASVGPRRSSTLAEALAHIHFNSPEGYRDPIKYSPDHSAPTGFIGDQFSRVSSRESLSSLIVEDYFGGSTAGSRTSGSSESESECFFPEFESEYSEDEDSFFRPAPP